MDKDAPAPRSVQRAGHILCLSDLGGSYARNVFDEFVEPSIIGGYRGMKDGDGVLCFNFRADRVREILSALLDSDIFAFRRRRAIDIAAAAGMTEYSQQLKPLMQAIFPSQALANVLGQVVSAAGRTQLRIAETEKYPHVTYFLNGGREDQYPGEDRIMVSSSKVQRARVSVTDPIVGRQCDGDHRA